MDKTVYILAGMPKSGTAYLYNMVNDMVAGNGGADAKTLTNLNHYSWIKWSNRNIGKYSFFKIASLRNITGKHGSFVVKSHSIPNWQLKCSLLLFRLRIVYIYRDPRDAYLSAMDRGKQLRSEGHNRTFAKFESFEHAMNRVRVWIKGAREFRSLKSSHCVKYEDLIEDTLAEMKAIAAFLEINISQKDLIDIVNRYKKTGDKKNLQGLHLNKGIGYRHLTELPQDLREYFIENFGDEIVELGYAL